MIDTTPCEPVPELTRGAALPPGVVVVGMHRSATSLTTSVLSACGWTTPGAMLAAGRNNRRGYYEDRRIHDLHVEALKDLDMSWDTAPELHARRREELTLDARADEVNAVIGYLRAHGPWVWKNPRATLFLEDWARRLPDATFVVCVRAPGAVVDSLLRRGNSLNVPVGGRLRRFRVGARALSLWHSYNVRAYRFARRHPGRVTIVRIPEDLPALATATRPSRFDPALLTEAPRREIRLFCWLDLRSQLLYRLLLRRYSPQRLAALLAGPAG